MRRVDYATPAECLERLDELEAETGRRWSMTRFPNTGRYHPLNDGGAVRDVACNTKKLYTSKSKAKTALKALRRVGRSSLIIYPCWYSRNGDHYHLGHPPGEQTYKRSGRVYG